MTPTSLFRISGFVLAVAAVVFLGGCRRSTTAFTPEQPAQPVSSAPSTASSSASQDADMREGARRAVIQYVTALTNRKYAAAYEMLSRDSQAMHSLSEFEQRGRQGMPPLDLETASVSTDEGQTVVELRFLEDPGSHGFYLVREDENWKIVYRGGSPGVPYPSSASGG